MLSDEELEDIVFKNPHKPRRGDEPDCFYISTLARSQQDEYQRKLNPTRPSDDNLNTLFGKAVHQYLQQRFITKGGWKQEAGVVLKIPYEFTFDNVHVTEIVLVGYADLYHPEKHEVIELKSTLKDKAAITKPYKLQLGMYAKLLEDKYQTPLKAEVIRFAGEEIGRYQLTQDEIQYGYNTIIRRAKKVADMLNGQEKKVE